MFLAAFIKAQLHGFSSWMTEAVQVLWRYRVIVIALVTIYVVFWQMDQGQDLLVNLNDNHLGVILFYCVIAAVAALFWHLPKYFSRNTDVHWMRLSQALRDVMTGAIAYKTNSQRDVNIARLLGTLTFILPAFAVLNVLDKYGISVPDPGLYFLLTLLFYIVIYHLNWIEVTYQNIPKSRKYFHLAIVAGVVAIASFGIFNHKHPSDLKWLCAGLCVMSVVFAICVSIRKHLTNRGGIGWIRKRYASRWIMIVNVSLALVFMLINFFPFAGTFVPLFTISAVLCGLVFHVLLFSFLLVWTRVTKVNFAAFFVAIAFLMAVFSENPFHEIRQIDTDSPRNDLDKYISAWLEYRKPEVAVRNPAHPYPIFIVNAYGGGIRAAAWTSLAIQRLDSAVHEKYPDDDFQRHVIAYSGASGGTIGASVLIALRKDKKNITQGSIKNFYQRDFLSPVVIGLIGRDFFFSTFGNVFSWLGINQEDRSAIQDKVWEMQMNDAFASSSYAEELASLYGSNPELPLLLANTTEIKKGLKGIVSPVRMDSIDFYGAVQVDRLLKRGQGLKLSTAAFMSARFPVISPAGKIDSANYFMDGGLKENSGAETARQLRGVLDRIIRSDTFFAGRVRIYMLSLPNTSTVAPEILRKQINQLTAPLEALATNWEGNTRIADSLNRVLFQGSIFSLRPTNTLLHDENGAYKAVLPLGWQMSSRALDRLESSLTENRTRIDEISRVF